jgi:ubiquinone/menaquinone biosynthesis C-methylase UbiE
MCQKVMLDGNLSLAPVGESPARVLDIATGTGIWAIEFANAHPDSKVIGTDFSQIQPDGVASNCSFVVEDAEEEEW